MFRVVFPFQPPSFLARPAFRFLFVAVDDQNCLSFPESFFDVVLLVFVNFPTVLV